jgi:hypothetical protein
VYEIEATHEHLVRAYAEHATGIDPPATALGLDVTEEGRDDVRRQVVGAALRSSGVPPSWRRPKSRRQLLRLLDGIK